jgi:hypothetical protein
MLVLMFACGGDDSPTAPTPPPAPAPVPPAPAPPSTPSTSEIFGVLREIDPSVGVPIQGGTVQITTGPNAGKSTTTDGNGYYVFNEVTRGTFTLRSSANGYEPGEQSVTLANPRQQDLQLRPVLQILDQTLTGAVSGGTASRCGSFTTKPCATFSIPIHHAGTLEAVLSWNSGVNDLDLELYRGTTELASSNGVSRNEERISSQVSQGMYQIRVIYYNGSTVQDFQLRVRRPN